MFLTHETRRLLLDRTRRFFGGMPCRLQVAALPWRRSPDGIEIMLVTSRGVGRWVLPKGWPEGSEQLSDAAAREAKEEAGLRGDMAAREIGRFFYEKGLASGMSWRCEVHVFPLEVVAQADRWPEMKKRQRRWFRAVDAAKLVSEPDLSEIIAKFAVNHQKSAA